jgi:hypothetical protein
VYFKTLSSQKENQTHPEKIKISKLMLKNIEK